MIYKSNINSFEIIEIPSHLIMLLKFPGNVEFLIHCDGQNFSNILLLIIIFQFIYI